MSPSRFLVLVAALAAVAGGASTATAAGVSFDSPSRNLGCSYFDYSPSSYVVCDRRNDGRGAIVRGRPARAQRYDLGAPPLNRRVLAYGKILRLGRFVCVSRTNGIACVAGNGAGFRIAREAIVIFKAR